MMLTISLPLSGEEYRQRLLHPSTTRIQLWNMAQSLLENPLLARDCHLKRLLEDVFDALLHQAVLSRNAVNVKEIRRIFQKAPQWSFTKRRILYSWLYQVLLMEEGFGT
jgi:hypothetical protein